MKLKLVLPVTGFAPELRDQIAEYLRQYPEAACELELEGIQYGFASVENELSGMVNGAQTAIQLHQMPKDVQGVFIDCFDDPGVYQCREMLDIPVVGAYHAAIATALQCGDRIGIITTDHAGILNEEKKAREYGVSDRIVAVRPVDASVAEIISDKEKILKALIDLCAKMEREDRVSCICLGCTGMFHIYRDLLQRLQQENVKVPVIEPTINGILTLKHMVEMNLSTHIPGSVNFDTLVWKQQ